MSNEKLSNSSNRYIVFLKELLGKLDKIQTVLANYRKNGNYSEIDGLVNVYESIFEEGELSKHINFELKFVPKSTHAVFPASLNRENSYYHLTLKIHSRDLRWFDDLYDGRITDLLKFFKHLFSTIDNFYILENKSKIDKYVFLLMDLELDLKSFIELSEKEEYDLPQLLQARRDEQERLKDQLKNGILFKSTGALDEIRSILALHKISKLFHFTDRSNLESIRKCGHLFSWGYCEFRNIKINRPGGSMNSRSYDKKRELHNYVRLSFCEDHPMKYAAKRDGRLIDPVVLEIDSEVTGWIGTKYSDVNAVTNGANIGDDASFLKAVKFEIMNQKYFGLSIDDKAKYQAEVLVFEKIPVKYIANINEL